MLYRLDRVISRIRPLIQKCLTSCGLHGKLIIELTQAIKGFLYCCQEQIIVVRLWVSQPDFFFHLFPGKLCAGLIDSRTFACYAKRVNRKAGTWCGLASSYKGRRWRHAKLVTDVRDVTVAANSFLCSLSLHLDQKYQKYQRLGPRFRLAQPRYSLG